MLYSLEKEVRFVLLQNSHPDLGTLTRVLVLLGSHVLFAEGPEASAAPKLADCCFRRRPQNGTK